MNKSEQQHKREAALVLLAKTGMWRSNYEPPILRLMWRAGVDVPPPHFAQFWQNAAVTGGFYAIAWGLLMYFFVWSKIDKPLTSMLMSAGIAGILFGFALACYYAYGKRKYKLPSWANFQP